MLNVTETVYAQFANSPRLLTLINSADQSLDPRKLISTFLADVFDPDTAKGWGLDVWGRIVGVSRIVEVTSGRWFGFEEASDATDTITPANDAPFFNGATRQGITNNYVLSDDAFRKLIYAKAAANITNGSITSINALLMDLFGAPTQQIWLEEDTQNRTVTIVYDFDLTRIDATVLEVSGVLPRPSGVSLKFRKQKHEEQ